MKALFVEATSRSPKVSFNIENQKFEISGESRPDNIYEFYKPLLLWVKEIEIAYDENSKVFSKPLTFDFNFEYFNSTSAKYILDFLKIIGRLNLKGVQLTVRWFYEEDDADMLMVGKEMARMAKMPFEYVEIEL